MSTSQKNPPSREINYKGLNAISQSDVLDRFKKDKVGLSMETQYDPTKVKKAEVEIKELLSAHGHQFATIRTEVRPIPPARVAVTFIIKEGPKVKVGQDHLRRQQEPVIALSALRDEEPETHRHPPIDLLREPLLPHLRRHQAEGRCRARPLRLPGKGLFQGRGRRSQDQDPRYARQVLSLRQRRRQSAWTSLCPSRRASATPSPQSPSPATRPSPTQRRPAVALPHQRRRHHGYLQDPQGPGEPEKGLRRPRLHQLHSRPQPHRHQRQEEDHHPEHRYRRRQAVLRPPHRVPGQHHHPRQGHPPRARARRGRPLQQPGVGDQPAAPESAAATSIG